MTTTFLQPSAPLRISPLSAFFAMRRDPLAFLERLAREHGDIAHVRVGSRHVVLLNHPDLIRELLVTQARSFQKGAALQRARTVLGNGLLTSEGEFHLRQRRLAQPAFHRERIAAYAVTIAATTQRHAEAWQDGAQFDVAEEMARLTLIIAGATLFSADVEHDADTVGAALGDLMSLFGLLMLPFGAQLERLPIPPARRLRSARARLEAVVARLITERRASGDRGDLLSMLLLAQDADGSQMDDTQVRDEVLTLFLAGHETTANALAWTWYLLAQHPEIEEQFHAEIDNSIRGRTPSADDLPRLPYTRAVLAESMRLYPPAWTIGRQAQNDVTIGGHVIPAGSTVLVSQWITQRDPRFFPDPLRFDPSRWLAEGQMSQSGRLTKPGYFPFGAGTRMCIGESFAWMEGVLVLATVGQRWQLRLIPGQRITPKPAITLRPRNGIQMTLARRAHTS